MTDRRTDPVGQPAESFDQQVIEAASAHLDGVATPAEQARFGSDPRIDSLSATFGALRGHLVAPVPVDSPQREAHLAAALDAFTALTQPVSLAAVRARRARRLVPVMAIAAALAVVGVVIGSMAGRSGNHDQTAVEGTGAADVSVTRTQPKAPAAAPEAAASDQGNTSANTRPLAAAVAATIDPASSDTATSEPTSESGGVGDQPLYTANTTRQLLAIAKDSVDQRSAGAGSRIANPCPDVAGDVGAQLLWIDQPALLILSPNAQRPTDALVVNPTTCVVEASVTLGA
jgi:hypothetical protein